MAAKSTFISGKQSSRGQPLAEPATDGFPAEEDVSNPPPGSDQVADADADAGADQDADPDDRGEEEEDEGRPRKKPD